MQWCGSLLPHHCIVLNDALLPNFLTIVTLVRLKYKLLMMVTDRNMWQHFNIDFNIKFNTL